MTARTPLSITASTSQPAPTRWRETTAAPRGPAPLSGGKVSHTARRLRALLNRPGTVIVDVSNAPRRPDNLATGAPWLPLPHQAIPGTLWIPGAGRGEIPTPVND